MTDPEITTRTRVIIRASPCLVHDHVWNVPKVSKSPDTKQLNTLLLSVILLNPFPRCVIIAARNETVCTQTIPGKIRQIATLARLISVIIYPEVSIGNYCVGLHSFPPTRQRTGQECSVPVTMSGVSYEVVSSQPE